MSTPKTRCAICSKGNAVLKCEGCLQTFCYHHVLDHRQQLNQQLEDVEMKCDLMRETLNEQTTDSKKHPLMQQIDQWEEESIDRIRQTADEARRLLAKYTIGHVTEIDVKLSKVTHQIRKSRQENDFSESDLRQWQETLSKLKEKLSINSSRVAVRRDSSPFVARIHVDLPGKDIRSLVPQLSVLENRKVDTKWEQNGITIAGGNGSGHNLNQLYNPLSMSIDDDEQTIYIADYWNNRIMRWKSGAMKGEIAVNGTTENNRTNQINCPRDVLIDKNTNNLIICDIGNRQVVQWSCQNSTKDKTIISDIDCWGLAMDNYGYLYVSDYNKHEVKRWRIGDSNGIIVAGGHGYGHRLDQLNYPTYIFVDDEQSVYVSDRYNHRVMKWSVGAKEGVIVCGNQIEGNSLEQLSHPTGIVVDQSGTVYVADCNNHRVMRWSKDATQGSIVVGGNGHGEQANQLYNPWGLAFDRQKNLYVADNANHRIQKFNMDSTISS